MKIYMLLMLVGVIVGFSYIPSQRLPKQTTTVPPDSATYSGLMPYGSRAAHRRAGFGDRLIRGG